MTEGLDRIHHDGSRAYVSNGAPTIGETVRLALRVPRELEPEAVVLRTVVDGEPRIHPAWFDRTDGADAIWVTDMEMHHTVMHYRWLTTGGNAGYVWHTAAGTVDHDVNDATDFAITAYVDTPDWARRGVVYQIFPDRFASSGRQYPLPAWAVPRRWERHPEGRSRHTPHEYFGGDLWGIIERLDYLESLGVTAIYMTPFFPAGSTHRYDATTFDQVDPLLGGDEALIALTEAAHARGIRVIGDLTLNHTGVHHEWFERAAAGDEATRDFYTFNPALDYGYLCWLGVRSLPKLNYQSAALRSRIIDGPHSVMRKWLQPPFNLDGWRIDVGNMTARQGQFDANLEIARLAREVVAQEGDDKILVAEHFHDAGPDLPGDGWQGTMNYSAFMKPVWAWLRGAEFEGDWLGLPMRTPQFTGGQMVSTVRSFSARMPWRSWLASWTILGSHDTARIRTVVGSPGRHVAAAVLLTTTPGMPMVFAGDELGAVGNWGEDARTTHPWQDEAEWDATLLDTYRRLIALRTSSDALAIGGMRWVHVSDDCVAYLREEGDERLLVVAARDAVANLRIDADAYNIRALDPVFGFDADIVDGVIEIHVPGAGGGIWRVA